MVAKHCEYTEYCEYTENHWILHVVGCELYLNEKNVILNS